MTKRTSILVPLALITTIAMSGAAFAQAAGGAAGGGGGRGGGFGGGAGDSASDVIVILERVPGSIRRPRRRGFRATTTENSCTMQRVRSGNDAMLHLRCDQAR